MSEIKEGKDTSEHKLLESFGVESKNAKMISMILTVVGVLLPVLLDKIDPTSTAAIVIAAIAALAAKVGFKSLAVGKYAIGRSLVKAGAVNPPKES